MAYPQWLLLVFLVYWVAWAIRVNDRKVWATENSFTVLGVGTLILTHARWPLNNLSYTLIFIFFLLHTIGGHYCYARVPYDRWFSKIFGWNLTERLHLKRNHYDRLVHFAFGLLWAYPVQWALERYTTVQGIWSYLFSGSLILSVSMLFELLEWGIAALLGDGAGQDYLAAQGDEWDAHKDMGVASLGTVLTLGTTALIA